MSKALESPKPAKDKPLVGIALVIGDFSSKVNYVPFGQGSKALRRRSKKPALLDIPRDENV